MRLIARQGHIGLFGRRSVIVGKAAAMLFIKSGFRDVHSASVMSKSRARVSRVGSGIPCTFGSSTDRIINRRGDDICPMEKTVANINVPDEAYNALAEKLAAMRSGKY